MFAVNGVIPPMVTPLLDEDTLDHKGIEKLLNHLIGGGVHGLFILGTTGEGPSLSHTLRAELIKYVCDQVSTRIPVLVGVIDTSYKEAVQIAEVAENSGAHAVVLAPPPFYNINQEELYNFTKQFIREIGLPVYLYNNPGLVKISFEIETIAKLLKNPEILGIKDSSANMFYFHRLLTLAQGSDRPLLMGPEELLIESLLMGAQGGVPGGANIFPALYVNIYESLTNGHLDKAHELQAKVMELSEIVYGGGGYGSSRIINGIKCALKYLNICEDLMAQPLEKADQEKSKKIAQYLKKSM